MQKKIALSVQGIFCLLLMHSVNLVAQHNGKTRMDQTFYQWPAQGQAAISANGKYVVYETENLPVGKSTVTVQATNGKWKKEIIKPTSFSFITITNEYVAFNVAPDSLYMLKLGGTGTYYPGYNTTKYFDNGYLLATKDNVLHYFKEGKWLKLADLTDHYYDFNQVLGSNILVMCERVTKEGDKSYQWVLYDLKNGSKKIIREEKEIASAVIDQKHNKLAYISVLPGSPQSANTIIVYDFVTEKLTQINNTSYSQQFISSIREFNDKGDLLIFDLKDTAQHAVEVSPIGLRVWNWKDPQSQKEQVDNAGPKSYLAAASLSGATIIKLQHPFDQDFVHYRGGMGRAALVKETAGDCSPRESGRRSTVAACKISWSLMDMYTGQRKLLPDFNKKHYNQFFLSPANDYVLFYDFDLDDYYSFNLESQKLVRLTEGLESFFRRPANNYITRVSRGIAGWSKDKKSVFIYDQYDIWRFDLTGTVKPVNVTKGEGKNLGIGFGLFESKELLDDQKLVVVAFNDRTKENGFYQVDLAGKEKPGLLTMGPYKYYMQSVGGGDMHDGMKPVKAVGAEIYLIKRQSATEFPNWFVTNDFKTYTAVSDIHPENNVSFLTSELIRWKNSDGIELKGILYKPEDFDPSKKYPIVFNYYEVVSNALNDFIQPEPLCDGCNINPPTLVANGYLVFRPDFEYIWDSAGYSVVDALETAAKKLAAFPWADTSRMGLQGCSWGGYETNYAATYSKFFKAACTSSGVSDAVTVFSNKVVNESYFNIHWQHRYRSKPWEARKAFMEGSLLYNADKLQTPLLLMHTTIDDGVPFNEAAQFYICLRELQKPVWLLEYSGPEANHGLHKREQAVDFSRRMLQFFDHYLKGQPAPKWMTEGLPAAKAASGAFTSLELDANK